MAFLALKSLSVIFEMLIAAIDPGLNASAALLECGVGKPRFAELTDLATLPDGETNRQIHVPHLCALLERWEPDCCVIENVQVPVMGANAKGQRKSVMSPSGAFRFGLGCGMIRGVVLAYQIPVTMVHPRSWTRAFGLKGGDKKPHLAKLIELHPETAPYLLRVKDHNRSDAGLMALWYATMRGPLL